MIERGKWANVEQMDVGGRAQCLFTDLDFMSALKILSVVNDIITHLKNIIASCSI